MENSQEHATILIVEDIDWIRNGMTKAVEREGYRVFEAKDDAETFEFTELESIELILTEEKVPTFNALIARLGEHPILNSIPVAIVNPDAEDGARHGDAYLLPDYAGITPLLSGAKLARRSDPL